MEVGCNEVRKYEKLMKIGYKNVNFEMGTINLKRELWPKNPKKTSKTVLKMKSVYTGTMFLFFRHQF